VFPLTLLRKLKKLQIIKIHIQQLLCDMKEKITNIICTKIKITIEQLTNWCTEMLSLMRRSPQYVQAPSWNQKEVTNTFAQGLHRRSTLITA
jgi:hypothetical protein